jgi:hypothetical protein
MRGGALLVLCSAARVAAAEPPTSPIVDSDYAIELYDGVAYGNSAVVGMGGATVALAIGTAGTLFNPSAPAVKPTTDTDYWSWDYHIDAIAGTSTDYDNNGFTSSSSENVVATFGLGGRYGEWGAAVTGTVQSRPIVTADAMEPNLRASTYRIQVALARWLPRIDTAIGASLTIGSFSLAGDCMDGTCNTPLFSLSGAGVDVGATWAPRYRSVRLGAALSTPYRGSNYSGCDPADCAGWILPDTIVAAPRVSAGIAYRFAGTYWNQLVGGHFRDEKSVTLAGDVVITGPAENAYGLDAFGDQRLQRSGRHTSVSLRGGVEWEWKPGRLRLRAGSYWEPGRFVGVAGRLHGTLGIELRLFQFKFWGKPRRGRITVTSDAAERYANGGVSIGFWH